MIHGLDDACGNHHPDRAGGVGETRAEPDGAEPPPAWIRLHEVDRDDRELGADREPLKSPRREKPDNRERPDPSIRRGCREEQASNGHQNDGEHQRASTPGPVRDPGKQKPAERPEDEPEPEGEPSSDQCAFRIVEDLRGDRFRDADENRPVVPLERLPHAGGDETACRKTGRFLSRHR